MENRRIWAQERPHAPNTCPMRLAHKQCA